MLTRLKGAGRKLVQALGDLQSSDVRRLESRMGENNFIRIVQGAIKGCTIAGRRELPDDTI